MTFDGKVSGARAIILTDTGAGGPGYIHPKFVEANRIHTRPARADVFLGEAPQKADCTEECLVHLQMGSFSTKVWLLVLNIPEPYDTFLGDEWLKSQGARIIYDEDRLEFKKPT